MTTRSTGNKNLLAGTSKIGEFWATKAQLVAALGNPTICNSDIPGGVKRQILYEWRLRTGGGPLAIYDYKEWEDPDFADDKLICWQVGGRAEAYLTRREHRALRLLSDRLGVTVTDTRTRLQRPRAAKEAQR